MPRFSDPDLLAAGDVLDGFDCGTESLNRWLVDHAKPALAAGSARSYVVSDQQQGRVVGYHALCAAAVDRRDASVRARAGMPRHPVPAVLLARLAVDITVERHGLGAFLLRDAMVRAAAAAEQVGIRLLLAHAIDDRARSFYLYHGFEASPTDPLNVQLLIKDIKRSLDQGGR